MRNEVILVGILGCFAAQPANAQPHHLPPDIIFDNSKHVPRPSSEEHHRYSELFYMPGSCTPCFIKDKQAFMLFIEILQLTKWEDSYNKPSYRNYFQKLKPLSLTVIRRILDKSIDESKWHANPGALDEETVSKYSPEDLQVKGLLKLALDLQTVDRQWRKKQISTKIFSSRKTALLKEIRILVQKRI